MFATELSNFFGGRYIEIKLQPYSFFEFREACDFIQKQSTKTTILLPLQHDIKSV